MFFGSDSFGSRRLAEVPVLMAAVDGIATSGHGILGGNDIKTGEQTGEQNEAICDMTLCLRGL